MAKMCVLEDRECTNCGECDRCDLNPAKKCNNCGKCIDSEAKYRGIGIDDVLLEMEPLPGEEAEQEHHHHHDGGCDCCHHEE